MTELVRWLAPYLAALVLLLPLISWAGSPGRAQPARLGAAAVVLFVIACGLLWEDCTARAPVLLAIIVGLASLSIPAAGTQRLSEAFGRARLPLYLLSIASMGALIYIYLPIIVFLTSPGELAIHLDKLLKENARDAMRVVYVGAFVYAVAASSRLRTVLTFLAFGALTLCLLYAFALPFGYPAMNGLIFEQVPVSTNEHVLRAVVDAVVVVATLLLLLKLVLRFGARPALAALLVVNLSLGIACLVSVVGDLAPPEAELVSNAPTSERPIALAKDHDNVIVLFLDRLMGGFVEPILAQEPELATRLDGFTWYPKTISAGENSITGIPTLLGGYDYTPPEMNKRGLPLREVAAESYALLPHNFRKAGYAVSVVNPRMLGFTFKGDCAFLKVPGVACGHVPLTVIKPLADEHNVSTAALAESNYADLLTLLALMRATPFTTKAVLNQRGPWKAFIDHSAGTTFREWAELKALPQLSTTDATTSTLNVFLNALPHEPYFMSESCEPLRKKLKASAKGLEERGFANNFALQHYTAARCALLALADYFDWMRANGVYDNTRIVIVSDHGIAGPVDDHSSRAERGGTTDKQYVRTRSALFVKERGAHGPLATSEEFVPNAEVPRIVCADLAAAGGCTNPFLGDKPIGTGSSDPFLMTITPWRFNEQGPTAFRITQQMELRGKDPYDVKGWTTLPAP